MAPPSQPVTLEKRAGGFLLLKDRLLALWQAAQRTRPFRAFSRFTDVGGGVLSAGMSFQALFAVFAALWVGFGILAVSIRDNTELLATITDQINIYVPGLIGSGDEGVVSLNELLSGRALNWTSAVAAGSLIFVTLTWFTGTRRAIRLIFGLDVKQYKSALLLKLRDLVVAISLALAIVSSALLTVVSSSVFNWVLDQFGASRDTWIVGTLGTVSRYAAVYAIDVLILMGLHRWLAEVEVPIWRLLRGCMLGGLALFGLKILASVLLGGTSSNPLLASFAVIVGLLLWFNFICRVLLLTSAWIATGLDSKLGLPEAWGALRTQSALD